MVIFHSYVSLPEGKSWLFAKHGVLCFQIPLRDGGLLLDTNQDLLNKNWATKFRVVM